jgi:hypothetical protein
MSQDAGIEPRTVTTRLDLIHVLIFTKLNILTVLFNNFPIESGSRLVQPHLQGYGGHGGAVGPQRGHRQEMDQLADHCQEMDQLADHPPASTEQPPRQVHCKENSIYVFLFWELRGLRPDFALMCL